MEAEIKLVEGLTAVGISDSNHWVPMDGDRKYDGREGANMPMEMVLMALGGCTGMDVASILSNMHEPYSDIRVKLEAEQSEELPKVFTSIMINFIVKGNVDPKKLERAISLSQDKYCPVAAMLKNACPIEWEFEIVEEK